MSSPAMTGERLSRLFGSLRGRARDAARSAVAEARPWLHEAAQRSGLLSGEWPAHFHAGLAALRMNDMAAAARYWHDLMFRNPDLGAEDKARHAEEVKAAEANA